MATFEGYERREAKILGVLKEYGISSIDECKTICEEKGIDPYTIVQETQPICFENAKWAYTVGCAIAIKKGCTKAADAAAAIGIGLQAFCIPGSVAENRKVGLGHGNLGKMLLSEETECFAFLAGHESFAAAEGAIKIAPVSYTHLDVYKRQSRTSIWINTIPRKRSKGPWQRESIPRGWSCPGRKSA